MTMNKERKADIHSRLLIWGEAATGGVGLASSGNLLGALVSVDGDRGSRVLWSAEVEEIERAVCLLPDDERAVIKEFYTVLDSTVVQHCRALGMSSSKAYRLRDSAFSKLNITLAEFRCCV